MRTDAAVLAATLRESDWLPKPDLVGQSALVTFALFLAGPSSNCSSLLANPLSIDSRLMRSFRVPPRPRVEALDAERGGLPLRLVVVAAE